MYSLVPTVYRMVGATFLSMSLITSNFYSLIVGLFFLDATMPPFYPIAYTLVIISVTSYSLAPSPSAFKQESEEIQPILGINYP
jgi:solute carrier family 35 protein F1/2